MRVTISTHGIDGFKEAIARLSSEKVELAVTENVLMELADNIAAHARGIAPVGKVDGGALRDSIDSWMYRDDRIGAGVGIASRRALMANLKGDRADHFGPDDFYPAYVEYGYSIGRRRIPANPFLRVATDAEIAAFMGHFEEKVTGVLRKLVNDKND